MISSQFRQMPFFLVATFLFLLFALLESQSNVRGKLYGDEKPTPIPKELVTAIRNGQMDQIRKLVNDGVDLKSRDAEGNTPLILASLYASPESVDFLLKKGAEPNAVNKSGSTALIRAATDYEKTRILIDAGAKIGIRTEKLGNTPLILAARRYGNSKTVKLLIDRGANVNERNNLGTSPILSAAASGDPETVKLLVEKGADVNDQPKSKNPEDTGFAGGMRTPLMWAAFRNDIPMIRYLLDQKADPNLLRYHGTALSHATWHNNLEAAEILLDRGAKVDRRDKIADFTPLHWAASNDTLRPQLVKLLLSKGADPNAHGGEPIDAFVGIPQTPLLLAEKRGFTSIVELLRQAGAKATSARPIVKQALRKLPPQLDRSLISKATERAVALLQHTASKSREAFVNHGSKQDCTSCHQQFLPMAAIGHARERSIRWDRDAANEQMELIGKVTDILWKPDVLLQTVFHPDPAITFGYELFGLWSEKVPSSYLTDARIHHLVTIQQADGRWSPNLPRPPISSNDVSPTALAILAIKNYGWAGRKAEFDTSILRARKWLQSVKPEANEEMVYQLLGLHWAGEPKEKLTGLAKGLLKSQRKDGGWSQLPTLESDAYATGQALYALAVTVNHPIDDPAWQNGLRFLLETQQPDGSWHVIRRAFPVQPTMTSGFPHHRDSWISASGTSWAVLALSQTLDRGIASGKPLRVQQKASEETSRNTDPVDFAKQIKPLLERSCLSCHRGETPRSNYRVDNRSAILKGGDTGKDAIVPGKSDQSALIEYITDRIPEMEMPPLAKRDRFPGLKKEEIEIFRAWIDQGALWLKEILLTPSKK